MCMSVSLDESKSCMIVRIHVMFQTSREIALYRQKAIDLCMWMKKNCVNRNVGRCLLSHSGYPLLPTGLYQQITVQIGCWRKHNFLMCIFLKCA